MRILIVGSAASRGRALLTRSIGGDDFIAQGIERGHTLRVLTREPRHFAVAPSVECCAVDMAQPAAMARALVDQEAVIIAMGARPTWRALTSMSLCARRVVAAMIEARVERLLCVTGVGVGDSRGHGGYWFDRIVQPLLLRQIVADQEAAETVVRASSLRWTIVRPALLTNGSMTARYRILTELQHIVAATIARRDVVHFLFDELERNEFVGKSPLLTY